MNKPHTALLLVDVQNDFCEGGSLAVPDSDSVFATINQWIAHARAQGWPVVATRDWHPLEHCSFESRGGPWPEHCVQDTHGADFHPRMALPPHTVRVSKGTAFETDAYSAFDGTQLEQYFRRHGIDTLVVAGLALDVCVRATVHDARRLGFEVEVLVNGTRAVDPEEGARTLDTFAEEGVVLVRS